MFPDCKACWGSVCCEVRQVIVITCMVVRAVDCQVRACECPRGEVWRSLLLQRSPSWQAGSSGLRLHYTQRAPDLQGSTAALPSVCADLIILLGDSTLRHMHDHKLGVRWWFRSMGGKKCDTANKMEAVEPAAVYFAQSGPRFLCKPK